jgi:hypothetical protein
MPGTLYDCRQPQVDAVPPTTRKNRVSRGIAIRAGLLFAALFVIAIFVWQGI